MSTLILPNDTHDAYTLWKEEETKYIHKSFGITNTTFSSKQVLLKNASFWMENKILNMPSWKYLMHFHFNDQVKTLALRILFDVLAEIAPGHRKDSDIDLLAEYAAMLSTRRKLQILNIAKEDSDISTLGLPSNMSFLFMTHGSYSAYYMLMKEAKLTEKSLASNIYHQHLFCNCFKPLALSNAIRESDLEVLSRCLKILLSHFHKISTFNTFQDIFNNKKEQLAFFINCLNLLQKCDFVVDTDSLITFKQRILLWFSSQFPEEFKTFNILSSIDSDLDIKDIVHSLIYKETEPVIDCELPSF